MSQVYAVCDTPRNRLKCTRSSLTRERSHLQSLADCTKTCMLAPTVSSVQLQPRHYAGLQHRTMNCGSVCAIRSSALLGLLHARTGRHCTGTAACLQHTSTVHQHRACWSMLVCIIAGLTTACCIKSSHRQSRPGVPFPSLLKAAFTSESLFWADVLT